MLFYYQFKNSQLIDALGLFALAQPGNVSASALDCGGPGGRGGSGQTSTTPARRTGTALTPLSTVEKDAFSQAILEKYGALNLYQSVISQFGSVYPFSQVVRAEQQHANALVRQATKYGVTVPANPGLTSAATFADLSAACQAGVTAEIVLRKLGYKVKLAGG